MHRITCIDTHTGGEPTRVVCSGGPDLGTGPMADRRERFATEHDPFREAIILEPRGSNVMVGALLCEPVNPQASAGILFFNNVGMLGMCGHGTIGVAVALAHLDRIEPGEHLFETPVGDVRVNLLTPNEAAIQNVPSWRSTHAQSLHVPGVGDVTGDIAYGGNWFFLVKDAPLELTPGNIPTLTGRAQDIMDALAEQNITGEAGEQIDHIEFFAPSTTADARNFVLCPGGEYDRSPCGTGTSAKLACLAADGTLAPGEEWVQESIIGSRFTGHFKPHPDGEGRIIPTIRGEAHVCGENVLLLDPSDPFQFGIRRSQHG